ncbi:AAA family ATPase [Schumannella soli]|nr:AAA family ATPase [Schumannella soli]
MNDQENPIHLEITTLEAGDLESLDALCRAEDVASEPADLAEEARLAEKFDPAGLSAEQWLTRWAAEKAERAAKLERERAESNHAAIAAVGRGDWFRPYDWRTGQLAVALLDGMPELGDPDFEAAYCRSWSQDVSAAIRWARLGWRLDTISDAEADELGIAGWHRQEAATQRELERLRARDAAEERHAKDKLDRALTEASGRSLYADVAALRAEGVERPRPTIGRRTDGAALLYPAAVNVLLGDPEGGKTLVSAAVAAEVLCSGGSVLWVDADYNGEAATVARLEETFGVPGELLEDRDCFRLVTPEDRADLLGAIEDAATWRPTLAVLDSQGEIFGMFSVNADRDNEVTPVMRATSARLASLGAAVLVIDHLAKGKESRDYGASGSTAKKRAVDGALLRVVRQREFAPGKGGRADLLVIKDRHGSLREVSGPGKEPRAATFELYGDIEGNAGWEFVAPFGAEAPASGGGDDAAKLDALRPAPGSAWDVRQRMKWGAERAKNAWEAWVARGGDQK